MSYLLPHLENGWEVDQAILSEEDRVVVIRFGHDYDPTCMKIDEILYSIAEDIQNYAVIRFYVVNNEEKNVEATLQYHVNVPINDAFTLIGYDGIGSNFGNNRTVYIGSEGTYIKYGNAGFKVTDNVIKKMNPNGDWVGLDSKYVKVMPDSNYTITDDDELIIANNSMTSDRYLDLPTSSYAGRTIYVKDYSQKTINVRCNNRIIASNGNSPQSTASVNNTANMFIYDGYYWLQFYCG